MPFYCYYCDNCKEQHKLMRLINDVSELLCPKCGKDGRLERLYTDSFYVSQKSNIGSVTKEFIEQAKEELKDQKKELLNK